MKKNRIDWVDCAKGITLLLVIIGHTVSTDASNMVRAGIFSFHMTLFFVVSCVTGKLSNSNDEFVKKTEKGFKHLDVYKRQLQRWLLSWPLLRESQFQITLIP